MKTQSKAESIVDSILLTEFGNDNFVCIPWLTKDLEYGWLTTHNLKLYRDTRDDSKWWKTYGGSKYIIDKTGNIIWSIAASFPYIDDEIRKYNLIKELEFDKLVMDNKINLPLKEEYIDLLEFCVRSSYSEELQIELKKLIMKLKINPIFQSSRLLELLRISEMLLSGSL